MNPALQLIQFQNLSLGFSKLTLFIGQLPPNELPKKLHELTFSLIQISKSHQKRQLPTAPQILSYLYQTLCQYPNSTPLIIHTHLAFCKYYLNLYKSSPSSLALTSPYYLTITSRKSPKNEKITQVRKTKKKQIAEHINLFYFHLQSCTGLINADTEIPLVIYTYYKGSKGCQVLGHLEQAKMYGKLAYDLVQGGQGRLVGRVLYNWGVLGGETWGEVRKVMHKVGGEDKVRSDWRVFEEKYRNKSGTKKMEVMLKKQRDSKEIVKEQQDLQLSLIKKEDLTIQENFDNYLRNDMNTFRTEETPSHRKKRAKSQKFSIKQRQSAVKEDFIKKNRLSVIQTPQRAERQSLDHEQLVNILESFRKRVSEQQTLNNQNNQ